MQNVIITIHGEQFSPEDGESSTIELVTNGQMGHRDGVVLITYQESTDYGAAAQTTLLIDEERITLVRSGEANTQMVFEKGRRHVTYYDTPEGSLTVGILAHQVDAELSPQGGHIGILYDVDIDNNLTGKNYIVIELRPGGGGDILPPANGSVFYDRFVN